jgi:succinate dehydrogenase/fumarate reductase-like Fe-S protein
MTEQASATLSITRGDGESRYVQDFDIPFEPGASILDGLMWIREHVDATLAFRYSCISANVCKECVIRVDGRNAYACIERLKNGTTRLEPLTTKPVLRDLACQSVPPKERAHP